MTPELTIINGRAAVRSRITGVERWAREMVARLPRLRPEAYRVELPPAAFAHKIGHLWEQGVLPARAARARATLVFSPANLAPLAWPRNVLALHDAVALRHPELFSAAYVAWQRVLLVRVARRATRLVTGSEFARRELVELLGVPPTQVTVIAGGVDERFSVTVDPEPARRALGLPHGYVLTLGGHGARKNFDALGPTARALRDHGCELVIAGGGRSHLKEEAPVEHAHVIGFVPEEHLPGLYAGAAAFVLASRHEGFGLTCIEAMASGIPVVAADRAALPETCGGGALLVDPDDHDAIARATLTAAFDQPERARLRRAGLERAAAFSWEGTARRVDALLAEIAGAIRESAP